MGGSGGARAMGPGAQVCRGPEAGRPPPSLPTLGVSSPPCRRQGGSGLAELTLPPVLATRRYGRLARGPRVPCGVACGSLGGLAAQSTAVLVNSRADLAPSGGLLVPRLGCLRLSGALANHLMRVGWMSPAPWGLGRGLSRGTEAGAVKPRGCPAAVGPALHVS